MKKQIYLIAALGILFLSPNAHSQDSLSISLIDNYKSWGWESWVMSNGLITIATVPDIGARIMQYDLGEHPSIFINEDELGKTYTPNSNSQWPNFGGFKNWPAPQDRWNWPPPPTLDFGAYEAVSDSSVDSVSLTVTSPVEQWRAPNLRFRRTTTIYKNASRVKVDQTIINEGDISANWSLWDVTQQITNHPGETDFENFWVYFPINPESIFGDEGVNISASSSAWKGEVADGVYGVEFKPEAKKIFADSHIGWIAYVDERDGFVYGKTFEIDDSADYPDGGATVEVWINSDPYYLETEVLSPIVELESNGGSYTFTEDWWAAKITQGPVLSLNNTGATLSFDYNDTERLSGSFGVFHIGNAKLEFFNTNEIIESIFLSEVNPLEAFEFDEPVSFPPEADSVRVIIENNNQEYIGTLTSESIETFTTSNEQEHNQPVEFKLFQNYPNPFNPSTNIRFQIPRSMNVKLAVYDISGKEVSVLINEFRNEGIHTIKFDPSYLTSGVYFYKLTAGNISRVNKMLLIK